MAEPRLSLSLKPDRSTAGREMQRTSRLPPATRPPPTFQVSLYERGTGPEHPGMAP
jgi:hypothetical protein